MAMKHTLLRLTALALTVALVAVACSSDDTTADPDPVFVPDAPTSELEGVLAEVVGETGVPALGAAAFTSGGRLDMAATGVRRLGEDTPVSSEDRWHIGSNTKAMTAAVLGRLADKAQVALDTTLAEAFPQATLHRDYRDVTLADLLSHTGGTPGDTPDVDDAFLAMPVTEQRAATVDLVLTEAPEVPPHSLSRYSNLGYIVVGAAIEAATGTSWEDVMRAELFDPLGMTSCGFGAPGAVDDTDAPWGHDADGTPVNEDAPAVVGPAGTVHCSMDDWGKFLTELLRLNKGESDYLQPTTVERLFQPAPVPVEDTPGAGYALGWTVLSGGPNGTVYLHDGSNTMWYSQAVVVPDRDIAVLAVSNHEATGTQAVSMALAALAEMYPGA